jgi:hypothetical protein
MRLCLLMVPLALTASPALAQARPAPATGPEAITIPPELTDPAMADKLGRMMQAMSKAFLNLPVGEIEAAAEGRPATRADRRRTVRELGRKDDPNFERNLERDLAMTGPAIQASMKALAAALPAMMKGLSEAGRELEKATANMPSPTYPKQ